MLCQQAPLDVREIVGERDWCRGGCWLQAGYSEFDVERRKFGQTEGCCDPRLVWVKRSWLWGVWRSSVQRFDRRIHFSWRWQKGSSLELFVGEECIYLPWKTRSKTGKEVVKGILRSWSDIVQSCHTNSRANSFQVNPGRKGNAL